MGIWDRIVAAVRREARDVDHALDDATRRADAALDRREREQSATPAERLAMEQARAEQQDEEYEALRRQIEGGS